MFSSILFYVTLLALLLLISAFFAAAETIFFTLSRPQLARFKKSSNPLSKQLVHFLSKPRDILVTILFGNELTNIAISIIVASFFYLLFHRRLDVEMLTLLSVGVGTFLILIVGEIIPKSVGMLLAPALAPVTALLLRPLYAVLKPMRFVLVKLADWCVARFGPVKKEETLLAMEEEFRHLLELGTKSGEVQEAERELIHKALEFSGKVVSQIKTPFSLVVSHDVNTPYTELLDQIKATQFSRIPIYEEKPTNIIGLLYVKDLLPFDRRLKSEPNLSIREILRPPLFVSREKNIEELLQEIRQSRIHMAIVVDANNKPIGLVTMHDILEELFGEVE